MKICHTCKQEKPKQEFHKNKSAKDGLQDSCKKCKRLYSTQHREENREAATTYWATHIDGIRVCEKCGLKKPLVDFNKDLRHKDGLTYACRACMKEQDRIWRENRSDEAKEVKKKQCKIYYREHSTTLKEASKKWRMDNYERSHSYFGIKYKTDENFRLISTLRGRIRKVLHGKTKSAATRELLGCAVSELWDYLEARFQNDMTRENYGKVWHVDHIIPCSRFDLSDPEQQRKCFHYTNLQPLFALDNISKGNKLLHEMGCK